MSMRTLYLAWKDKEGYDQQWFPVGRLDVEPSSHRFRYIHGAERAQKEAGFFPLPDFPDMNGDYRSGKLFALFENRVMAAGRPGRTAYLSNLGLPKDADPAQILSVSGGARVTDTFEVFPKIEADNDGKVSCRFFVHGSQYAEQSVKERLERLKPGEKLDMTPQLCGPTTVTGVLVWTMEGCLVGWTPRYLVDVLKQVLDKKTGHYETQVRVVRINPPPATSDRRILVEIHGCWNEYEPMSDRDYQPLVD